MQTMQIETAAHINGIARLDNTIFELIEHSVYLYVDNNISGLLEYIPEQ